MLKIRDNVDLKELEKFGFECEDNDGYKPSQFFQINYCPMCGRKLREE